MVKTTVVGIHINKEQKLCCAIVNFVISVCDELHDNMLGFPYFSCFEDGWKAEANILVNIYTYGNFSKYLKYCRVMQTKNFQKIEPSCILRLNAAGLQYI